MIRNSTARAKGSSSHKPGLPLSWIVTCAFILAITLAYNACGQKTVFDGSSRGGSGVGNPMQAKAIVASMCRTLTNCHAGLTTDACQAGLLSTSGFGPQFGLDRGAFATLASILDAEAAGTIVGNVDAGSSCTSAIEALSCANSLVHAAYDSSQANPFAASIYMVPTASSSCPIVFSEPPERSDYYVSTTGNDNNDGSKERPWASLTHAARTLIPSTRGATVHVGAGIYSSSPVACSGYQSTCAVATERSGSPNARIVYLSDPPGAAKIVGNGAGSVWYNSGDYVDIVGFEIVGDASSDVGIQNEGSSVRVRNNLVHSISVAQACAASLGGGGIRHGNRLGRDNESIGNIVYDIGALPANGGAAASYCNHAHGISHLQPGGRILNNIIYRVSTYGISTWLDASDMQIGHNLIFSSGATAGNGSRIGGGITIGAGEGAAGSVHDRTSVFNNIIRNNSGIAVLEYGATGPANTYTNNLIYSNAAGFSLQNGVTDQGTLTSDPLMVDFRANGGGDYRLAPLSPAIDSGTVSGGIATDLDGFIRPFGANPDLGPYEWHP